MAVFPVKAFCSIATAINKIWRKCITTRTDMYVFQIRKMIKTVHSFAVDINTIEMNYKCLSKWYITPNKELTKQEGEVMMFWEIWCKFGGIVQN